MLKLVTLKDSKVYVLSISPSSNQRDIALEMSANLSSKMMGSYFTEGFVAKGSSVWSLLNSLKVDTSLRQTAIIG